ncbi:MAG TPA: DUF1360 domain-containing protein [Acidobacteriaceae bacterium]|nr:DUF1360 domain-containing protein [Acidobacteriaceae bacterium]
MTTLKFAIAVLAVWRVTHLMNAEDGPLRIFDRVRGWLRRIALGELMDCFYCLSLWTAAPFALWLGSDWLERGALWLALSAAAILMNRVIEGAAESATQAGLFYEEPYKEEKTECHAVEAHDEAELKTHRHPPARSA